MDYRKLSDHLALLLIVALASFGIGMLVRLAALEAGLDVGTANLAFVGVLAACAVVYIVIVSIWANSVFPWVLRKLGFRARQERGLPETAFADASPAALSMKEKALLRQAEEFEKRIGLFVEYASAAVGPYISEKDLKRLSEYIELYARNARLPAGAEPILTKELTNPDLFHFGWNMWKHFRVGKQGDVAIWLKTLFKNLRDCETSYIIGKLAVTEHLHYLIPKVEDIAGYMK